MCCLCNLIFPLFHLCVSLFLNTDWLRLFTPHLHPSPLTYPSHLCLVCVWCGSAQIVLIGFNCASKACWLAEFRFVGIFQFVTHSGSCDAPVYGCVQLFFFVFRWLLILSKKMFLHPLFLSLSFIFHLNCIYSFRYVNPTSLVSYGNVIWSLSGSICQAGLGGQKWDEKGWMFWSISSFHIGLCWIACVVMSCFIDYAWPKYSYYCVLLCLGTVFIHFCILMNYNHKLCYLLLNLMWKTNTK